MNKKLLSIIWLLGSTLLFLPARAQHGPVTFAQLQDSMRLHPRPVVIEIYTDWCSYCSMQNRQIKRAPAVQQLLSEQYYFVTLNAEARQPIIFNDTIYPFMPNGDRGIHALAAKLMHQPRAYPTWVLLDTSWQIKGAYTGLLKPRELERFLREYHTY